MQAQWSRAVSSDRKDVIPDAGSWHRLAPAGRLGWLPDRVRSWLRIRGDQSRVADEVAGASNEDEFWMHSWWGRLEGQCLPLAPWDGWMDTCVGCCCVLVSVGFMFSSIVWFITAKQWPNKTILQPFHVHLSGFVRKRKGEKEVQGKWALNYKAERKLFAGLGSIINVPFWSAKK